MKPITVLDVAIAKGARVENGSISGAEFDRLGLPMFGGCQHCGASIATYNAYPSKTGYLQCSNCIGNAGFENAAAFYLWLEKWGDL